MNDNTDLGHDTDDSAAIKKLRADLRSLPRVSAPLDFEHHLRQRIEAETAKKKLPWWRSVLPGLSGEAWRVPAFAYGGVTTIIVIAFSVYMVRVTDIEQSIEDETGQSPNAVPTELQEAPIELQPDRDGEAVESMPQADEVAGDRFEDEADADNLRRNAAKELRTPVPRQKMNTAAPDAPTYRSESAEEDATQFAPRVRGIMPADLTGRADSAAIADSLRALDSLRSVRERTIREPVRDATQ